MCFYTTQATIPREESLLQFETQAFVSSVAGLNLFLCFMCCIYIFANLFGYFKPTLYLNCRYVRKSFKRSHICCNIHDVTALVSVCVKRSFSCISKCHMTCEGDGDAVIPCGFSRLICLLYYCFCIILNSLYCNSVFFFFPPQKQKCSS